MTTTLPLHFMTAVSKLKSGCSALLAGSRTIPLGDNGPVIRDLADSAARRATKGGTRDPFRKA